MLQMKLFRKQSFTPDLAELPTVRFGNPTVLGVPFQMDFPGLRDVTQRAAQLRLAPVSLGVEAFVAFVEAAHQTDLRVTNLEFSPPLEPEEAEHLTELIVAAQQGGGMSALTAFLVHVVRSTASIIKAVTFLVPDAPRHAKVTVFNNGIIFVNQDEPILDRIDWAVSQMAEYRSRHPQA